MSIFLTRPVINTKEERNAKADILELINFERENALRRILLSTSRGIKAMETDL